MLSCEQNNLVAKFYTGNNKKKQKDAVWSFWGVCMCVCAHNYETSGNGKKFFLTDILVVAVIQTNWTFSFNFGTTGGMKLFWLFLVKTVHLAVKVAVEFISLSFFWIWLHGQNYSWKLFHPYKCTMFTIKNTILLSHLIWEKSFTSLKWFFFSKFTLSVLFHCFLMNGKIKLLCSSDFLNYK